MLERSATDRLLALVDAFDVSPAAEALFGEAIRDAARWHHEHSAVYRGLCELAGFDPAASASLAEIPWVFVNAFKFHELLSVAPEDVALTLTSSGTGGQKSRIFFDRISLERALAMVARVFDSMGLVNREEEVNYLLFAYDPQEARNVGTAYTDDNLTSFTRKRSVYHALRWDADRGEFTFRVEEAYERLLAFAAEGYPVRIFGFPAFLHKLVRFHRGLGAEPLALGRRSFVHTGGGWKKSEHEAIDKAQLRAEVEEAFGIPVANIRDGYGLVEHSVPYIECEHHRFHVSAYARAIVRDVRTLAPLPDGEVGFLELLTPYIRSMPAHALLTSDLAELGHGCPCGREAAWIAIMGRAGTQKNKGCAIAAVESLLGDERAAGRVR